MNITDRFNQLSTRFKWAVGLVAALIISPIIFMVVQGIVGLMIAGVLGLAAIHGAPYLSMKFANWKVKGIRAEAAQNPIETMINLLIAKRAAFKEFQNNVTLAVTARNGFKTKIESFAKKYPARAPEFQLQLKSMTDLVERKKVALVEAERMLDEGQHKLEEMLAFWDISQAAQAANRAAGMDTGDQFERLKADTAVDAVFESMNRAFAELEVAASLNVEEVDKPSQLPYNQPVVLEILTTKELVKSTTARL